MVSAALMIFLGSQTPAMAAPQDKPPASAAQVDRLLACRSNPDPAQRLACFDREAAGLADGMAKRDVIVVDREAVRTTKRTLFGLSLPRIGILDDGKEEITSLEGVIEKVSRNSDGGYYFFLKDGARWSQIDGRVVAVEPRPGDKVLIRKAALGSYMLSVDRQPGVRVRRIN